MDFLQFSKAMYEAIESIEKYSNDIKKDVALRLVKELTAITPVDTSKAISNWQVGIGAPGSSEIEAHLLGSKGSTQQESAKIAVDTAQRALTQSKAEIPVFVYNKASYIKDLNNGSSKQAPKSFVETAVSKIANGG